MKKPNKPESQIQEVLYYLLTRLKIDRRQMMLSAGVLNLPNQIMILRRNYGLKIILTDRIVFNKFGREINYGEYSIEDKIQARSVYDLIQKNHRLRESRKSEKV